MQSAVRTRFSPRRSHDYQQPQQQQPKSISADLDLSELWCFGPDFETHSVFNLLGDNTYAEPCLTQSSAASNWWMPSPSRWNQALVPEGQVYTPRSVMSELGPQSPASVVPKRPLSDLSNRPTGETIDRAGSMRTSNARLSVVQRVDRSWAVIRRRRSRRCRNRTFPRLFVRSRQICTIGFLARPPR